MTLLAGACALAQAQTTPGQLLQDIRSLQPQLHELPAPSAEGGLTLAPQDSGKSGQLTFVVQQFVFEGQERVSVSALQAVLADWLGKPITYDDLKQGIQALANFYRDQGLLARAVLPPQDITDGHVTVQIIESRLGGLAIDNRSFRLRDAQIQTWFAQQTPMGRLIELPVLDHALLTLGDLPTVNVDGFLQEGEAPGQTVLALTVQDKPRYNGQALLDNFGDKNTGQARTSAQLNVNGLMGYSDQLNLYGLHTQGSNYVRLGWTTTPATATRGQRVGVYASQMDYSITNAAFQSTQGPVVTGSAEVLGLEATDPLIRSRTTNAVVSFNWARTL